jgi:HEAT repeat protein
LAKNRTLEGRLAALNELRDDPTSLEATKALDRALESKISFLVARAAEIIRDHELDTFDASLARAFERFMVDPEKTDKGCKAKIAIAEALQRAGYNDDAVFLRGLRHTQLEPVYGGSVDTAGQLRGVCAIGLAQMHYPEIMIELARLLADPEPAARGAAARAIGAAATEAVGVPILRFKVLTGDADHRVLCECMGALLELDPAGSVGFLDEILHTSQPATCEAALLVLGESQLENAFDVIEPWWRECRDASLRRTALLAMSLLRKERAVQYLLSLVGTASPEVARDAIDALAIHRYDEKIRRRVEEIAGSREDIDLVPLVAARFRDG